MNRLPDDSMSTMAPVSTKTSQATFELSSLKNKGVSIEVQSKGDEESIPASPTLSFPEGGSQAWLSVLGAFFIQFTCFGYTNSFGVYNDYYTQTYLTNYTPTDIGWIGGVQVFLTFCTGLITGRLFDRGYFRYLVISTLILNSLGLFMLSITHENSYYQVFLTHGVMLGLSSGMSYTASFGIAAQYFLKRRPLAVGIISSGSALGAVINPIMLNKFFNGHIGFHNGVRISAALNTFLLIISLIVMRTRLPPKKAQSFPIGQWIKDPSYATTLLSCFFLFFGLFYPVFSIQLSAVKHGVNLNLASYTTSILNAASMMGRIVPGLLAPKVGVFNLAIISMTSMAIIIFCLDAVKTAAGTVLVAIFFGFFSGATIGIAPAMIAQQCKGPAEYGTRLGLYLAMGGLVGLFATALDGALLTTEYIWIRPIIFNGIMALVASACYIVTRYFYGRGKEGFLL